MHHLLLAKRFWGFLDGTEEFAEDATAQAHEEFKKEQSILHDCTSCLCTTQLHLITSCEKPKDAWDAL